MGTGAEIPIALAAASGGQAALSNSKSGDPAIPGVFRDSVQDALGQAVFMLNAPPQQFGIPLTAPASPFEIAALGGIADLALNQGAPRPTTGASAFGGTPLAFFPGFEQNRAKPKNPRSSG